jgi:hypothetical protein
MEHFVLVARLKPDETSAMANPNSFDGAGSSVRASAESVGGLAHSLHLEGSGWLVSFRDPALMKQSIRPTFRVSVTFPTAASV